MNKVQLLHSQTIISPLFVFPSLPFRKPPSPRFICHLPPYSSMTTLRRNTALSVLAATSCLSAVAGGPTLVGWTALFGVAGVVTDVPVGIIGLAAGICAGITDLVAFDIGAGMLDKGALPFLVFALGGLIAGGWEAIGEDEEKERRVVDADQKEESKGGEEELEGEGEFVSWDGEFNKRDDSS